MNRFVSLDVDKDNNNSSNNKNKCQNLYIQQYSVNPTSTGWNIYQVIACLYWPKFLRVIFCYCSYTWATQLVRGVFRGYLHLLVQGYQGSRVCFLESL